MKRILTIILAFIFTASIGLGVFFGVKYKSNIKNTISGWFNKDTSTEEEIDYKELYEEEKLSNKLLQDNLNSYGGLKVETFRETLSDNMIYISIGNYNYTIDKNNPIFYISSQKELNNVETYACGDISYFDVCVRVYNLKYKNSYNTVTFYDYLPSTESTALFAYCGDFPSSFDEETQICKVRLDIEETDGVVSELYFNFLEILEV